jgi:pimeloyl-ACP methyl ester carboxylesterase
MMSYENRAAVMGVVMFLAFAWGTGVAAGADADADADAERGYRDGAEVSDFHGYRRYDFDLEGRACYVIEPAEAAPGTPWVWRARFDSKAFSAFDVAMLGEGYHVAKVDVAGLFGGPEAMEVFDDFYKVVTTAYGFGARPVLEGLSRGGLAIFNWGVEHPEQVTCLYGDAAVCDFKSWPGGKGKGKGSEKAWEQCLGAYGMTEEEAMEWKGNPVDRAAALAEAGVPVVFVYGDADEVVPAEENALVMEAQYNAALPEGGVPMKMIAKTGVGHHPHGLEDASEVVAFVKEAAGSGGE